MMRKNATDDRVPARAAESLFIFQTVHPALTGADTARPESVERFPDFSAERAIFKCSDIIGSDHRFLRPARHIFGVFR